uniref:GPCR family 3 nine cysteines domain-containing protein n=1 Tax=Anabas testudineus TaxID=64144 RepID=A0A3Q1IYB4_ANATE
MNFDKNGDPPASYDIINWHVTPQGAGEFVTVGHFLSSQGPDGQFHINMDRVVWGGGSRQRVPVSVCSSPCPPGTRRAVQKGRPVCCFDCLPCADGEITNKTGTLRNKLLTLLFI